MSDPSTAIKTMNTMAGRMSHATQLRNGVLSHVFLASGEQKLGKPKSGKAKEPLRSDAFFSSRLVVLLKIVALSAEEALSFFAGITPDSVLEWGVRTWVVVLYTTTNAAVFGGGRMGIMAVDG